MNFFSSKNVDFTPNLSLQYFPIFSPFFVRSSKKEPALNESSLAGAQNLPEELFIFVILFCTCKQFHEIFGRFLNLPEELFISCNFFFVKQFHEI